MRRPITWVGASARIRAAKWPLKHAYPGLKVTVDKAITLSTVTTTPFNIEIFQWVTNHKKKSGRLTLNCHFAAVACIYMSRRLASGEFEFECSAERLDDFTTCIELINAALTEDRRRSGFP